MSDESREHLRAVGNELRLTRLWMGFAAVCGLLLGTIVLVRLAIWFAPVVAYTESIADLPTVHGTMAPYLCLTVVAGFALRGAWVAGPTDADRALRAHQVVWVAATISLAVTCLAFAYTRALTGDFPVIP